MDWIGWYDTAWHDTAWYGVAWRGMAWIYVLQRRTMFYICVRDWASCDRFWTRRGLCCSNGSTPSDAEPIGVVLGMYHCWILSALHMIRRRSGGESMGNRRVLTRDVSHSNCSAACAVQWSVCFVYGMWAGHTSNRSGGRSSGLTDWRVGACCGIIK